MPRPKVYATHQNAVAIYHYFANALHKRQLFEEESAKLEAASIAFSQISNPHTNSIQDGMDNFLIALKK